MHLRPPHTAVVRVQGLSRHLDRATFIDFLHPLDYDVKLTTRGPQSLLDMIKCDEQGVFPYSEAERVYTAEGRGNDEKRIKNTLAQWKKRKFIEELPDGKYRKIKADINAK